MEEHVNAGLVQRHNSLPQSYSRLVGCKYDRKTYTCYHSNKSHQGYQDQRQVTVSHHSSEL